MYLCYEDPEDPLNIKFMKFANLRWMRDEFNVDASELMDFQMMDSSAGMVAFHKRGILRIIAFTYEEDDK